MVELSIGTTLPATFIRFDGPVALTLNAAMSGFDVHWAARANSEVALPAHRHVDVVFVDRGGTVFFRGDATVPSDRIEAGLSYHAVMEVPAELVPGRYRAVVLLDGTAGEVGEVIVDIPDEPPAQEPAGPPWLAFSWGPTWNGGAVCWGATNTGESAVFAGSVADTVHIEGDNGFQWHDAVALPSTVEPGGQYESALMLGDLEPGRYLAYVTLCISGQAQSVMWET